MDLYGSSGFTKKDLKAVEKAASLSPKGYVLDQRTSIYTFRRYFLDARREAAP